MPAVLPPPGLPLEEKENGCLFIRAFGTFADLSALSFPPMNWRATVSCPPAGGQKFPKRQSSKAANLKSQISIRQISNLKSQISIRQIHPIGMTEYSPGIYPGGEGACTIQSPDGANERGLSCKHRITC